MTHHDLLNTLIGTTCSLMCVATIRAQQPDPAATTPHAPRAVSIGPIDLGTSIAAPAWQAGVSDIIVEGHAGTLLATRQGSHPKHTREVRYSTGTFERVVVVDANPFKYSYKIVVGDTTVVAEASPLAFFSAVIPGFAFVSPATTNDAREVAADQFSTQVTLFPNSYPAGLQSQTEHHLLTNATTPADSDLHRANIERLKDKMWSEIDASPTLSGYSNLLKAAGPQALAATTPPQPSECGGVRALADRERAMGGAQALLVQFLNHIDTNVTAFAPLYRDVQRSTMDDRAGSSAIRLWAFVADTMLVHEMDTLSRDSVILVPLLDSVLVTSRRLKLAANEADTNASSFGDTKPKGPAGCRDSVKIAQIDALVQASDTSAAVTRLAGLSVFRSHLSQDQHAYAATWPDESRFWIAANLHRYDHTTDVTVHVIRKILPPPPSTGPADSSAKPQGASDSGATTITTTISTTTKLAPSSSPTASSSSTTAGGAKAAASSGPSSSNGGGNGKGNSSAPSPSNPPTSSTTNTQSASAHANASPPSDSTDWQVTVHYDSPGFFSIGAGLMYGALGAPQYGVLRRRVAAPPGAPGDTISQRIALTDSSSYRVAPVATLSFRLWQITPRGSTGFLDAMHLTAGVGVLPKSGDVSVDYLVGLSLTLLDNRFMLTPGLYIGRKNYLLNGVHVGDASADPTTAPTGSRMVAEFGLGLTYRIF